MFLNNITCWNKDLLRRHVNGVAVLSNIQSDYLHVNYADSQSALIFRAYLARFVDFICSTRDEIA